MEDSFYISVAILYCFSPTGIGDGCSWTWYGFLIFLFGIGGVLDSSGGGGGRCHNVKNDKEASEVTEGKSSRMGWER